MEYERSSETPKSKRQISAKTTLSVGDSPDINVLLLSASTLFYFRLLYSGYQPGNDVVVRYLHGMKELLQKGKK
jgi:hypothetical protein